jgi:predicted phage terminase large subunit-like protein
LISPLNRLHIRRIVVGVDPAVTSGESADDTGIVVAARARDDEFYVLEDLTCHLSPDGWARRVGYAYYRWQADRIVAEANNGGELVSTVLATVDKSLPVKLVHAARGKQTRAEPVAALYEQGKVHHVGGFPALEDEMTTWIPGEGSSPDRVDALVWAITELVGGAAAAAPEFSRSQSKWKVG